MELISIDDKMKDMLGKVPLEELRLLDTVSGNGLFLLAIQSLRAADHSFGYSPDFVVSMQAR